MLRRRLGGTGWGQVETGARRAVATCVPHVMVIHQGQLGALAVMRALKRGGARVTLAIASSSPVSAGASRHADHVVQHPPLGDRGCFLEFAGEAARTGGVDVILPMGEAALVAMHPYRAELEEIVPLAAAPAASIAIAVDKAATIDHARDVQGGLRVPATTTPLSAAEAATWRGRFPVLVKPRTGTGAVGVRLAGDTAELRRAFELTTREHGPALVQEVIDYRPGGKFVLLYLFDHGGDLAAWYDQRILLECRAIAVGDGTMRRRGGNSLLWRSELERESPGEGPSPAREHGLARSCRHRRRLRPPRRAALSVRDQSAPRRDRHARPVARAEPRLRRLPRGPAARSTAAAGPGGGAPGTQGSVHNVGRTRAAARAGASRPSLPATRADPSRPCSVRSRGGPALEQAAPREHGDGSGRLSRRVRAVCRLSSRSNGTMAPASGSHAPAVRTRHSPSPRVGPRRARPGRSPRMRAYISTNMSTVSAAPQGRRDAAHVLDHDRTGEIVEELPPDPLGRPGAVEQLRRSCATPGRSRRRRGGRSARAGG